MISDNPCVDTNGNPINEGLPLPPRDPCESDCQCTYGRIICALITCESVPQGCTPITDPGQCCPRFECPGK